MQRKILWSLSIVGTLLGFTAHVANAEGPNQNQVSLGSGGSIARGQTVPVGTFIYTGQVTPSDANKGGYVYVDQFSIYAAGSAATLNSTLVTEVAILDRTTQGQLDVITNRINTQTGRAGSNANNSIANFSSGGNGGSSSGKYGVWFNAGYMHIDDKTAGGKWDGDLWMAHLGFDYRFSPRFLMGIAFYYSFLDGDTKFNNGEIEDHSYGPTLYASWKATGWLSFDAVGSYSHQEKDRERKQLINNAVPSVFGQKIKSSPKSDRWFAAFFGNLTRTINKWNLLGRVGYTHAEDHQKRFKESNGLEYTAQTVRLDQLLVRLQAGYKVNNMVEPYLFALYNRDFKQTKLAVFSAETSVIPSYKNPELHRGKNTFGGGLGVNLVHNNGWNGYAEYTFAQKKKLQSHRALARLAYQW